MGATRSTIIAGIMLALAGGCATPPEAVSDTATPSGASVAAATLSHCSRGCPEGAPSGNEEVRHAFYTLSNNPTTKFADWVAYIVDPQWIGGPDRPRNWKADPDLAAADTLEPDDYDGISQLHMDRGHQAPLEAFTRSPQWREANYLSNITPQDLTLNRGRWARLEKAERDLAQARDEAVFVVTGPLYEEDTHDLPQADEPHRIPSGYWKVVSMRAGGAAGFIFSQAPDEGTYCDHIAPVSEIESRSGLDLFPNATPPVQMDFAQLGC
jgi:endonuclease G